MKMVHAIHIGEPDQEKMHQVSVVRNELLRLDVCRPEVTLALDAKKKAAVRLQCRQRIRRIGGPGLGLTVASVYIPPRIAETDDDQQKGRSPKHGDPGPAQPLRRWSLPRLQLSFSHRGADNGDDADGEEDHAAKKEGAEGFLHSQGTLRKCRYRQAEFRLTPRTIDLKSDLQVISLHDPNAADKESRILWRSLCQVRGSLQFVTEPGKTQDIHSNLLNVVGIAANLDLRQAGNDLRHAYRHKHVISASIVFVKYVGASDVSVGGGTYDKCQGNKK